MKITGRRVVFALGWLMALCIGSGVAWAEEMQNIRYRVTGYAGKTFEVDFPYLRLDDPVATKRVNALLHHLVLQTLPPESGQAPGAAPLPLPERDGTATLTSIEAKDIQTINEGRVLLVPIVSEGCGANCSYSTAVFAFDTKTGRLLLIPEILTRGGMAILATQALPVHRATLKRTLTQLRKKLKTASSGSDDLERIAGQIDMYERCLEDRYSPQSTLYRNDPGFLNFKEGGLSFDQGKCSAYVNLALDDVGNLMYSPSAQVLRPHLTAYGRTLVFGDDRADADKELAPVNPYAQMFKGRINARLPVTLFLGANGYSSGAEMKPFSEATYYYDKYRSPIPLSVTREGETYTLTESGGAEQAPADRPRLTFRIESSKLKGQWRGGGKTYGFEATAL